MTTARTRARPSPSRSRGRPGFQSAQSLVSLPESKQNLVLLVTLGRGVAELPPMPDDLQRQYEHFK